MTNNMSISRGNLVLVIDFGKAMLLENAGSAFAPEFVVQYAKEMGDNPPTREQGTDKPGTLYAGSHHSTVEQTDWHEDAGHRFIETALDEIRAMPILQEKTPLFLVAPPRTLAFLREHAGALAAVSIGGELAKDLTGMPVAEIARHLAA